MPDAVLVVDGNSTLRKTVAQRLHLEGFAPVTVPTPLEALQLLSNGVPARLIILGLTNPVVDAGTFREELRHHNPGFAEIPIIVMTASGTLDNQADGVPCTTMDCEKVMRLVRAAFPAPHGMQSFRIQLFL
jgi:CheY-like chemotaxis protein